MKNFLKTKTPLIITICLFALFNLIFFVSVNFNTANTALWIGYGFIDLAFVFLGIGTVAIKLKSKSTMTTIWPLMYVFVGYLAVSFIMNLIIMLVNPEKPTAAIVLNAILLILAFIVFLIAFKSFSRVADNTERREKRVASLRETSIKVNALSFLTKDDDIIKAVKKLKENVDYSSSAGNEASASYEEKFTAQIETINTLLIAKADKEAVLEAIEVAENLLKVRNQMVMAGKVS